MREKRVITGISGSAASFFLGLELSKNPAESCLIITPTEQDAENCAGELNCFLPSVMRVALYPPWESKPFDHLTPNLDTISERISALWSLRNENIILVSSVDAIMQRVIPRAVLNSSTIHIKRETECELSALRKKLEIMGYRFQEQITSMGEAAIRGNIIDIFPPTKKTAIRLELFDTNVETISALNIATQRSEDSLESITITPVREVMLTEETMRIARESIKTNSDALGIPKQSRDRWIEQLLSGIMIPEIDGWLPFFCAKLETIFDYLPNNALLAVIDKPRVLENALDFETTCNDMWKHAKNEFRLVPPIDALYLSESDTKNICLERGEIQISPLSGENAGNSIEVRTEPVIGLSTKSYVRTKDPLAPLISHLKRWKNEGKHILFVLHTEEQSNRLSGLLNTHGFELRRIQDDVLSAIPTLNPSPRIINTVLGYINKSFVYNDRHVVLISEEDIFGIKRKRRPKSWLEPASAAFFATIDELKVGDPVVHVEHGIGRYDGLEQIVMDGIRKDFLLITYKDKDRLFLPVHRVNLLQKYLGSSGGRILLDQLGGHGWERRKQRAGKSVKDLAEELLRLYAKREAAVGFQFSPPDNYFLEFEGNFEFEETEDQQKSIDDIIDDMCSKKIMDRLVCGDVGYGKTEVAMRAAFKAVLDKKQVAVLCPTTLLASQHEQTFKKRFSDFSVNVEQLSRLKTKNEKKQILEKLQNGEVDIIIGTHSLLSKDVKFSDLGLVVIDEEQRFGVAHKERLKKIRSEVDTVTMTATPIPRTLSLAMGGIRDLSIINTPPVDRHTIKTFVATFHPDVIKAAIPEEIKRGGQIFFVHNRVETIDATALMLKGILPGVRIGVAHGQLSERSLEKVMTRFLNKELDLLVCSSIIESGLDIPSANTLIVNRADTFGLAQLYQLRGRIGRSREQAFAYFLIPSEQTITIEAQKRLEVLQRHTEFGSGFRIASHDLEIRGGGNILGREQSGHIAAIGFELYTKLLDEAVRSLKGEKVESQIEPEITIKVQAFLPESYIKDTQQRLSMYKRLAMAQTDDALNAYEQELRDRFGHPPKEVTMLMRVMALKQRLQKLRVLSLHSGDDDIVLEFDPSTPLSQEFIVSLITNNPVKFKLKSENRLLINLEMPSIDTILAEVESLLKTIQ